ncbi:putative complement C3-like [Triplophysa rosa]|uniref:Complement C3-like n=1 Tax=Triplophysa rosa TaxID=992332 RepID=A0A9W7WYT1_TRIRA|nr:putative complement C3-like [Triplophysa rosa]
MNVHLLCLTVVLLSSPLLTSCDPLFVLSAPNLLRVGSSENVFVEAQDYIGGDVKVNIMVKTFPTKRIHLLSKTVFLTWENNFQVLTDIEIPAEANFFERDVEKQFVYLQAEFPTKTLEKVVMVSFQSGYIFVQTDKPIYTPASTVQYRVFSLTPNLHPHSQSGVSVDIMNPQGLTVATEQVFPTQGMKSGRYRISEVASPGIWKVVTRYSKTPQKTFSSDFEVKEYVLPTFEVTLSPSRSFFYVGDERLTVDITAEYLFGKKVEGQAFVVFGVMDGESKTSISASLQRVPIAERKSSAELTRDMITQTFPNINKLVGKSIFVSVSVLTETGSEMVEAQKRGIQIVTSPYTIHFKRTPQFFKPGMPFDVSVYVTNPDQTPANYVQVEVNPGGIRGQTKANGIAKFTVNTQRDSPSLQITVRPAKTIDPRLQNEQQAVKTMTAQAYIPKSNSQNYLHVGIDAAELEIGDQMKVNLYTGKSPGAEDQDYTYMIISKGQIVMVDRYKRRGPALVTLSLPVSKDMVPSFRFVAYYHVGSNEVVSDSVWVDVKDTCTGAVVDKAVHVLNKNRLTQFTAGSGRDSMGVFYDAGLMFESSTLEETNTRTMNECPTPSRRRRRSDVRLYDSDEIVSRTQFPESWLWRGVTVPQCQDKTCVLSKDKIYLKYSITNWQILAISLSNTNGICVADPLEMVVFKDFFIDLKMPVPRPFATSSWKSKPSFTIPAHGRRRQFQVSKRCPPSHSQQVRVEFMETQHICSAASKKDKYRTIVEVDGFSTRSVPYVIIPMELGKHQIEVKAAQDDSVHTDGVKKTLKVVSEGVLVEVMVKTVELNPEKQGGEQHEVIITSAPADWLPDTPASTLITVTGVETAQTLEPAISGDFMGRLIVQPAGNGEQNVMYMTLPLIATHYLDSTNQWEAVGVDRRTEAVKHITTGYHKQLAYRKSDGSYAAWVHIQSSTWLTAYVAKIFAMASNLVSVEEDVLCSALRWLVLNKQLPDGSFKEDQPIFTIIMGGDVHGKDGDASLTAFVLIAMQEGSEFCARSVDSLHVSMRIAVGFLEGKLPSLTNPYAVAMTSYAMANANKLNKDVLMKHSTKQEAGTAWIVPEQHYHSLEATAYAVLALVKAKDYDTAGEAVHWLARQQSHYGGSGTTQATIMVFQAVAEYHTQVKKDLDFHLDVEVSVSGRSRPIRWRFRKDNVHVTHSDKFDLSKNFNVTAKGTGTATLSVLRLYYAKPADNVKTCNQFDLNVKIARDHEVSYLGAEETYTLTIDVSYKRERDATMSILDVGLLTGFKVDERDLAELTTGKDRFIQKFEMNRELSERGSLILYLNKVSHAERDRIAFRMHKVNKVGLLQPAAVTVYEYYSPDARCMKYYHPDKEDGALSRLCHGDVCQCAEENCSYQNKYKINADQRLDKACEASMDYVYKVTVEGVNLGTHTDVYNMKVNQVLREGIDKDVRGTVRTFLAHPNCRTSLGLEHGKSYLIMGKFTSRLHYMLGEQTWIEYWPTIEESQTPEHRDRYLGIMDLASNLQEEGCVI